MNRIQQLRQEKRMSQVRLSIELGVSQGAVSDYECGKSNPSVAVLLAMSKLFNASCDYILGVSDIRAVQKGAENDGDIQLLSGYHMLSPMEQAMVRAYIQAFIDKRR